MSIKQLKEYDGPIRFGDSKLIALIKHEQKHNVETMRRTVSVPILVKAGFEKPQAIDIMRRVIETEKK